MYTQIIKHKIIIFNKSIGDIISLINRNMKFDFSGQNPNNLEDPGKMRDPVKIGHRPRFPISILSICML